MVIDMGNRGLEGDGRAVFAETRGYWEALRAGGQLPRRSDLDPRGLKYSLHQTLIAEQIAPGLARVRLAGAAFTDVMGMELRGMPLSALFDPMARTSLESVLAEVFSGEVAVTLLLEAARGLGRPALTAQLLLLPMVSDQGGVDLVLGSMVLRGTAGRAPRRFHILNVQRETLMTEATVPETAKMFAFAAPQVAYQTAMPVAKAPYLRVVK
jgi:hypothetical protein